MKSEDINEFNADTKAPKTTGQQFYHRLTRFSLPKILHPVKVSVIMQTAPDLRVSRRSRIRYSFGEVYRGWPVESHFTRSLSDWKTGILCEEKVWFLSQSFRNSLLVYEIYRRKVLYLTTKDNAGVSIRSIISVNDVSVCPLLYSKKLTTPETPHSRVDRVPTVQDSLLVW